MRRAVFLASCVSVVTATACIGCGDDSGPNPVPLPSAGSGAETISGAGGTGGTTDLTSGTGGDTGGFGATGAAGTTSDSGTPNGSAGTGSGGTGTGAGGTAFDSGAPNGSAGTGSGGTTLDSGALDGSGATSGLGAGGNVATGGSGATDGVDASDGNVTTGGSGAIVGADPVPSDGCGADSPLSGNFTIDVQGTTREYTVKAPDNYDSNTPYRLIFAWHGLGGTASMTARNWYGLEARANNSAILIAGQAQAGTGQGGFASWAIHPDESDMHYTRAMLEWAEVNYCIDTGRVFSIGMSNGGMMSNIVGCELGDLFRAIAVVAGGRIRCSLFTSARSHWVSSGPIGP